MSESMEGFVDVNAGASESEAAAPEDIGSVEERAVAFKMRLMEKPIERPAPDGEVASDEPAPKTAAAPATTDPAAEPAPAGAGNERVKRLEELRAKERAHIDETLRQKGVADMQRKLEDQQRALAEREARLAHWEKLESGDPNAAIEYLTKKVRDPDGISKAIASMTDPDARMESLVERVRGEFQGELAKLREENQRLAAEREAANRAEAERQAAEQAQSQFNSFAKEHAAEAPWAVQLMERAPDDFIERAEAIAATYLRQGKPYSFADILLDLDARAARLLGSAEAGKQVANGTTSKTASAGNGSRAGGATSLPNNVAQERTAIVEDSDDEDLSYDERVSRLQHRLRGQPMPRRG